MRQVRTVGRRTETPPLHETFRASETGPHLSPFSVEGEVAELLNKMTNGGEGREGVCTGPTPLPKEDITSKWSVWGEN